MCWVDFGCCYEYIWALFGISEWGRWKERGLNALQGHAVWWESLGAARLRTRIRERGRSSAGWMHSCFAHLTHLRALRLDASGSPLCAIRLQLSLFVSPFHLTSFSCRLLFTHCLIPRSRCDGSFFHSACVLQAAICSIWQFTLAKASQQ